MSVLSRIVMLACYVITCHLSAVVIVRASLYLHPRDQMGAAIGGAIISWVFLTLAYWKSGGFEDWEFDDE